MFSEMYVPLYDIGDPDGDYTIICVYQIINDKGDIVFEDVNCEKFERDIYEK